MINKIGCATGAVITAVTNFSGYMLEYVSKCQVTSLNFVDRLMLPKWSSSPVKMSRNVENNFEAVA